MAIMNRETKTKLVKANSKIILEATWEELKRNKSKAMLALATVAAVGIAWAWLKKSK
ncbi:MAG: hypothetical protein LAT68_12435 [Cyclobacteriaceae bacterium]|nr:hypothetical protein [Cyclobacteriaceae bacterium]MCH8517125.1 hypothetical protein [Cyclobacteriaceae bacterium]